MAVPQIEISGGDSAADHRCGFVALVGPANAGKSTLLNALLGSKVSIVSHRPQTTRNRVVGVRTLENAQLIFVDTPGYLPSRVVSGSAKLRAVRRGAVLDKFISKEMSDGADGADFVVLVLDVSKLTRRSAERLTDSPVSLVDLKQQLELFKLRQPQVIVLNKVDLVSKLELLPVIAGLGELFGSIDFIPVAALKRDGVDELLALLAKKLPIGPCLFPIETTRLHSDRVLAEEIVREKVFILLREELPFASVVVVESWVYEEGRLCIGARICVERDSQRGIVIGKGGSMIKQIGTLARQDLERLLGTRINLELVVRVEPEWTERESFVARLSQFVGGNE